MALFCAGPALAWTYIVQGEPELNPEKDMGYFIWIEKQGKDSVIHLRATGSGRRVFSGHITTGRKSAISQKVDFAGEDFVKEKSPTEFHFRFVCDNEVKGFTITTKSPVINFVKMTMNGEPVYMGTFRAGKYKERLNTPPFSLFDINPDSPPMMPPGVKLVPSKDK